MTSIPTSCISSNTIPKKYVSPSHKIQDSTKKADIPIIDLQGENNITTQILNASQTVGVFLVINHGIPIEKMNKAMKNIEDFHNLPIEERNKYPLESDTNKVCCVQSHNDERMVKFGYWRDGIRLHCTPLDETIKFWPDNPKSFKEDIGDLVLEVKDLSSRILEHLSEGLELERGYLGGELSSSYSLIVNHYPPSLDPKSTLGFQKHVDWNVIAVLQSGHVPGLQLFKDGQWFDIETPPEAFCVLMGSQLEVISNGKIKGALHRVTTSSSESRYSANFSRYPPQDCLVEPAKEILKAQNSPPFYKSFRFKDIMETSRVLNVNPEDLAESMHKLITIN